MDKRIDKSRVNLSISSQERERYARQLALPDIGEAGQARLKAARVLVVGLGGLGSPVSLYLAAAGLGTLGLVDSDIVEASNLQRQILHTTPGVGTRKTLTATASIGALNPHVVLEPHAQRFTASNALPLIRQYDFVVDATDNLESKFMIADVCYAAGIPYSHAGIYEFMGQTMTVIPGTSCCYRCIFRSEPPNMPSQPRGPLGVVPAVIGSIQATEVLKFFLGIGQLLVNSLLVYDALSMTFRKVKTPRNPECTLCGPSADAVLQDR
jgi:molybdopterin/thiamine biosynthesis adenylyltransferase